MNKKPGRTGPRIRVTRPLCKVKKLDTIPSTSISVIDERKYIYHCQYCRLKFTQNSHFFRHMTSNHELQQKQAIFQCNECHIVFTRKNELDLHCQAQHQVKSKLKCECCAIKFKSVYCLRRHKVLKQSLQDNSCVMCHKKFSNEDWLEKHVRNKHKIKYQSYECDFCALKYKYKESLLIHLKRIHKRL